MNINKMTVVQCFSPILPGPTKISQKFINRCADLKDDVGNLKDNARHLFLQTVCDSREALREECFDSCEYFITRYREKSANEVKNLVGLKGDSKFEKTWHHPYKIWKTLNKRFQLLVSNLPLDKSQQIISLSHLNTKNIDIQPKSIEDINKSLRVLIEIYLSIGFTDFSDINLTDVPLVSLVFKSKDETEVNMSGSLFGSGHWSSYNQFIIASQFDKVNAQKCNFFSASYYGCTLKDVNFSESKFRGVQFINCTIINCKFDKCDINDLSITGTLMINASFIDARISKLNLCLQHDSENVDLSQVQNFTNLTNVSIYNYDQEKDSYIKTPLTTPDIINFNIYSKLSIKDLKSMVSVKILNGLDFKSGITIEYGQLPQIIIDSFEYHNVVDPVSHIEFQKKDKIVLVMEINRIRIYLKDTVLGMLKNDMAFHPDNRISFLYEDNILWAGKFKQKIVDYLTPECFGVTPKK